MNRESPEAGVAPRCVEVGWALAHLAQGRIMIKMTCNYLRFISSVLPTAPVIPTFYFRYCVALHHMLKQLLVDC